MSESELRRMATSLPNQLDVLLEEFVDELGKPHPASHGLLGEVRRQLEDGVGLYRTCRARP